MTDYPDLYADGYNITVGPFGVTVTLMRSEGADASGTPSPTNEIVGRVRMSKDLAEHMAEAMRNTIAQSKKGMVAPTTGETTKGN